MGLCVTFGSSFTQYTHDLNRALILNAKQNYQQKMKNDKFRHQVWIISGLLLTIAESWSSKRILSD